jgi:hypothetical protein
MFDCDVIMLFVHQSGRSTGADQGSHTEHFSLVQESNPSMLMTVIPEAKIVH